LQPEDNAPQQVVIAVSAIHTIFRRFTTGLRWVTQSHGVAEAEAH
jgi:hypothetical protein